MRVVTLFGGEPVPQVLRAAPYVFGVDRLLTNEDLALAHRLERECVLLTQLCTVPNTPFTNRFTFRGRSH
jgi:hypothetical protein